MRNCPNCSRPVAASSRFCASCGTEVSVHRVVLGPAPSRRTGVSSTARPGPDRMRGTLATRPLLIDTVTDGSDGRRDLTFTSAFRPTRGTKAPRLSRRTRTPTPAEFGIRTWRGLDVTVPDPPTTPSAPISWPT